MTNTELVISLERAVQQYDLRRHPVYEAWMSGSLTSDDRRKYSLEYYHHVAAFQRYLREFVRRLPAGELRHEVFQVLCEEERKIAHGAHAVSWSSFAAGLGAQTTTMVSPPLPKTRQLIDIYMELARSGSEAEVLAAFYVYHSHASRVTVQKAASLRDRNEISDEAFEYLVSQGEVYTRHANVWQKQLIRILGNDPSALPYSLIAAQLAAKALWRALDGISSRMTSASMT
jgi:pyrroloquinoline-quinone synthase